MHCRLDFRNPGAKWKRGLCVELLQRQKIRAAGANETLMKAATLNPKLLKIRLKGMGIVTLEASGLGLRCIRHSMLASRSKGVCISIFCVALLDRLCFVPLLCRRGRFDSPASDLLIRVIPQPTSRELENCRVLDPWQPDCARQRCRVGNESNELQPEVEDSDDANAEDDDGLLKEIMWMRKRNVHRTVRNSMSHSHV